MTPDCSLFHIQKCIHAQALCSSVCRTIWAMKQTRSPRGQFPGTHGKPQGGRHLTGISGYTGLSYLLLLLLRSVLRNMQAYAISSILIVLPLVWGAYKLSELEIDISGDYKIFTKEDMAKFDGSNVSIQPPPSPRPSIWWQLTCTNAWASCQINLQPEYCGHRFLSHT